jgi:phytoene dehydrogenase-like protein
MIDIIKMIKDLGPNINFLKKHSKMTMDEYAKKFKSPVLQKAIRSFEFDSSSNDSFIIPFSLATRDFGFSKGGPLSFVKSIEQRYTSLGGTVHYNAKVKKILVANNKAVGIQLEDGTEVNADIVISAADGYSTIFKMLEGKYINKKIKQLHENEPLMPFYLQVSIGVDMDVSHYAGLNSIYTVYELGQPIIISGEERKFIQIENYAFDPASSPPGKTTFAVSYYSKAVYWKKIYNDREKYMNEKKIEEETVISSLEKIIPGIKEKIEVVDIATPMTIIRYTDNRQGSINGFLRPFLINIPRTLPKLSGFYMAGQWVGDSNVSSTAQSGRSCLEYICKKDKKSFITTKPQKEN